MGSEKRQPDSPIIERLAKEYYRFSFFKAVNLLETLLPDKEPIGKTLVPRKEAVTFTVPPGFKFPASDIVDLKLDPENGQANMAVAFMGLVGPSGLLPNWYNQLALNRNSEKDKSLTAFFDLFHHRLISLFYLAWKKNRFPINYKPGARDRLSGYLLSLNGLGTKGLTGRIGLPEESLTFYSGLLSRQVPSAVNIKSAVEFFSGTAVSVDQFVNRMIPLDFEDQTQIGMANSRLGEDTVCGDAVWECQTKFRVNLGPMDFTSFLRFQPTGDLLGPVFSLIRYMVGMEFEFEIRLILDRHEVPPFILGEQTATSPRLGWSTWLKSPGYIHDDDPTITFQEADLIKKKSH